MSAEPKFYDPDYKDVTDFINKLKTHLVRTKQEAIILANQTRSYFYEVRDQNHKYVGYAVPK